MALEVSAQELRKLLGTNGDRIHVDQGSDVYEHVQLEGFEPGVLRAKECIPLKDCTKQEVRLIKQALREGLVKTVPCLVGKIHFHIVVMH